MAVAEQLMRTKELAGQLKIMYDIVENMTQDEQAEVYRYIEAFSDMIQAGGKLSMAAFSIVAHNVAVSALAADLDDVEISDNGSNDNG